MKYFIKRKKLPYSETHHDFTLTICLGIMQGETGEYEAKVQIPVESYRDGLRTYRNFIRDQKEYQERAQDSPQASNSPEKNRKQQSNSQGTSDSPQVGNILKESPWKRAIALN